MGNSWYDFAYDMAMEEQYERELFDQNVEHFTRDRLQSYLLAHPRIIEPANAALRTANELLESNPTPSLVFAAIAQEVAIRDALLTPVVYGLVANESAAKLITSHAVGTGSPTKFKKLILKLLHEHAGVDLLTHTRSQSQRSLWEEITQVVENRNAAVHRGDTFDAAAAKLALSVAEELIERVFPTVVSELGLHVHELIVCSDSHSGLS